MEWNGVVHETVVRTNSQRQTKHGRQDAKCGNHNETENGKENDKGVRHNGHEAMEFVW